MSAILCGDIGGTNSRLAIYRREGAFWACEAEKILPSTAFPSFDAVLQEFLQTFPFTGDRACFGIAGPILGRKCQATNLPWVVDADGIGRQYAWAKVELLNDLEALAYAIPELGPADFVELHAGTPQPGNAALIAAGTGLGEAGLFFDGQRHRPFATEGGHTDFAPRNSREIALLQFVQEKLGKRVSVERLVSGPGLVTLFEFCASLTNTPPAAAVLAAPPDQKAKQISLHGLERSCAICVEALELFVELYAAEAGNLCLKLMARGGLFLGGGIAPKILPALQQPRFLESFCAKGRMRPILEGIPIQVITQPDAALLGAAAFAASDL